MGYEGKAVVVDPDVFAVGDVWELLSRDMQGKAVMCRTRGTPPHFASSVMLLDCAKLKHWSIAEDFDALFTKKREYKIWMNLGYENPTTIGLIEPEWNDFDKLTDKTKMIHNTRRKTQPWKAGLPVDFVPAENNPYNPVMLLMRLRRKLFGEYALLGKYKAHPDQRQEQLFFSLLKEAVQKGFVDRGSPQGAHAREPRPPRRVRGAGAHPAAGAGAAEGGVGRSSAGPAHRPAAHPRDPPRNRAGASPPGPPRSTDARAWQLGLEDR